MGAFQMFGMIRVAGYQAYHDGIPKATEIVEIANFIQWVGIQKNRYSNVARQRYNFKFM